MPLRTTAKAETPDGTQQASGGETGIHNAPPFALMRADDDTIDILTADQIESTILIQNRSPIFRPPAHCAIFFLASPLHAISTFLGKSGTPPRSFSQGTATTDREARQQPAVSTPTLSRALGTRSRQRTLHRLAAGWRHNAGH